MFADIDYIRLGLYIVSLNKDNVTCCPSHIYNDTLDEQVYV